MVNKYIVISFIFLVFVLFYFLYFEVIDSQQPPTPIKIIKPAIEEEVKTEPLLQRKKNSKMESVEKFDDDERELDLSRRIPGFASMNDLHQYLVSRKIVEPFDFDENAPREFQLYQGAKSHEMARKINAVFQGAIQQSVNNKTQLKVGVLSEEKFKGPRDQTTLDCVYSRCKFSKLVNRRDVKNYDIILINTRGSYPGWVGDVKARDVIVRTDGTPTWLVHYMTESPIYTEDWVHMLPRTLMVDLTLTYRWDSDIPVSVPIVRLLKNPVDQDEVLENVLNSKRSKLIYWLISRCETHSGREKYVESLKRYLKIDIYGGVICVSSYCCIACGKKRCPSLLKRKPTRYNECMDEMTSEYKFYISFENSRCKNYISEKFWRPLNRYNVPIVLGGMSKSDYEEVAPPNSFIHVDDFKSARQLADYLKYLNSNETAFLDYHVWRSNFDLRFVWNADNESASYSHWCHMCDAVAANVPHERKSLTSWWFRDTCKLHPH